MACSCEEFSNFPGDVRNYFLTPTLHHLKVNSLRRREQQPLDAGRRERAHALGALRRRTGDREAMHEIIVHELRVDALLDRLRDIEAAHEALDEIGRASCRE